MTVNSNTGQTALVDAVAVTGTSAPTAATTNTITPNNITLTAQIVAAIQANTNVNTVVTVVDNMHGTFTITPTVTGTPYSIKVSTNITAPTQARILITQVTPGQDYTIKLNGRFITFRSPVNSATNINIAAGLVAAISAQNDFNVTATDNLDGSFEIQSLNPMNILLIPQDEMAIQKGLILDPLTPTNPVATDLDLVDAENDDWYALVLIDRTPSTVLSAAAWIESRVKLFATASSNADIINVAPGDDSTSVAAVLNNSGYMRTFCMYHQDALTDFPDAAWLGRVLPLTPGSETWAFKILNGVAYTELSTTQSQNALNKSCNIYQFEAGIGVTRQGTVAQGEYIDTVRGIDWLQARIQEYVFSALVNNPKVPYTDSGINSIKSEVMRALTQGQDNGFIALDPPYAVTAPRAADVPAIDKSNRILRNVKFTATLSGAIHVVQIQGFVSL